jgi:iron complex transport system ATP-binding protein
MTARALAQEPDLLLLDEPTAFLDVASRVELMVLLRRLTRETPLAAVLSTHDLELALRSADTIWLVMRGGEVVVGAPEDLVASGAIARAFDGPKVRFDLQSNTFQWLPGTLGVVRLRGNGPRAALARSAVERVGFAVDASSDEAQLLTIDVDDAGWRAVDDRLETRGVTFAEMADYLRSRTPR